MAADYKQPSVISKRVRFYDGQFLQDQDFVDEQKYHVDRQSRHQRTLHVSGVAEGLAVSAAGEPLQYRVSAGLAIDTNGRQIVLPRTTDALDLPADAAGGERWVHIAYHQEPSDLQASGDGVEGETRWHEAPYLFTAVSPLGVDDAYSGPDWQAYLTDGPPPPVLLAKLTIDADGSVTVDNGVRHYSGLRLPGPDAQAPALRTAPDGSLGFWLLHDGDMRENLTITQDGKVGLSTRTPGAALEISATLKATIQNRTLVGLKIAPTFNSNNMNGVKEYGLLVAGGLVGIGTTSPQTRLDVAGNIRGGLDTGNYTEMGHGGSHGYLNTVGAGRLDFRHDGNTKMALSDGGRLGIGIGSSEPGSALHVKSSENNSGLTIQTGDNANSQGIAFQNSGGAYTWHLFRQQTTYKNNASHANLVLAGGIDSTITNLTPFATFTPAGSVGVGTSTPGAKLSVRGEESGNHGQAAAIGLENSAAGGAAWYLRAGATGTATPAGGFSIANDNDYRLAIDGRGQVGIGKTDPQTMLDVNGNIRFTEQLQTSAIARISPIYIRGTGQNNNAKRKLVIGSSVVYDGGGRGLTLTIINKADHTVISSTNYDVYGSTDASDNLAAAMNGMTRDQIGVITSYDAWIRRATADLRTAMQRVGLYKGAKANGGHRSPYAAIFEAANTGDTWSATAVEALYSSDGNSPRAEIRGWLMDGGFVAGGTVPSALTSPESRYAAVSVNQSGNVGVGTTAPLQKLHVVAGGGFGGENDDGTSKSGSVAIVGQGNSTVFGLLNADGRQAFALNINGNNGTQTERGVPTFYDKYDGTWRAALSLKNGKVGIGMQNPDSLLTISNGSNGSLLKFNTQRAWLFKSTGSGATTGLQLQSLVDNKTFTIASKNGTVALDVNAKDGGGQVQARLWYSQEYEWNQGQGAVKMGHSSKCVAFLTYVRGKFEGGGEVVRVFVGSDGHWYLGGSSGQKDVRAKARCVGMP